MTKTRALTVPKKGKKLLSELEKEMESDYIDTMKTKIKSKIKQVRMAEITVTKLKKELNEMLSGDKKYSEEELLFEDD